MSHFSRKKLSLLERILAKVSLVDEALAREGKQLYDDEIKKAEKGRKYSKKYMQETRKIDKKYNFK